MGNPSNLARRVRGGQREELAWRKALHHECLLNIHRAANAQASETWTFDTRVLRETSAHAAAFDETVLQRIIWARSANEELEETIHRVEELRVTGKEFEERVQRISEAQILSDTELVDQLGQHIAVAGQIGPLRERVLGELMEIEVQLRPKIEPREKKRRFGLFGR